MEIRPILGARSGAWDHVNPIVGVGFGRNGTADFSPAARLAYKLNDDLLPGGSKGASERTTSTSPVNPMSRANLTSLH